MLQYKDLGIILKSQDFLETDRILTILTKKGGKIRAIARGIRRPTAKLAGSLEPFSLSQICFIEGRKDLDIIVGAEIVKSFKDIRDNLKKTAAVYYMVELIDKLIGEKEKSSPIFWQLKKTLDKINTVKKPNIELLVDYFIINILSILGYHPELKICQGCHKQFTPKTKKNYFSFKAGGIQCWRCANDDFQAMPISLENLKILKIFLDYDIDIVDKILPKNQLELSQIIERYAEFILERKINSSRFLKHINQQKD